MNIAQLITILSQLGLAAAAYRLASRLSIRVEDHEKRLGVLETVQP